MQKFITFLLFGLIWGTLSKAKTYDVTVSSNVFNPNVQSIEAGDTVRWTYAGGELAHNVFAFDGSYRCALGCEANGGNGNPSSEFWQSEVTFRTLGTSAYVCQPHLNFGMLGSIAVRAPENVTVHEIIAAPNNEFVPNDLTILRGDVVYFKNGGGVHNIHTNDDSLICSQGCLGDGTNTDSDPTGFDWEIYVRFDEIKDIPFFCDEHKNSGIIRVISDTFFNNGFE